MTALGNNLTYVRQLELLKKKKKQMFDKNIKVTEFYVFFFQNL